MITGHNLGECEYAGVFCRGCRSIIHQERQRLGQKARTEGSAARTSTDGARLPIDGPENDPEE